MTRVAVSVLPGSQPELLDRQLAFHLAAGVDAVVVADPTDGHLRASVREHASDERLRVVSVEPRLARVQLAAAALDEADADWLIEARPGEFWWPRGESLQEVLSPMPPRYGVVQGLVREFVALPDDGRPFWERMTARRSLLEAAAAQGDEVGRLLRPAYRTHPRLDPTVGGGPGTRQPLRAWYPLEVLTFDLSLQPDARSVERGLAEGTLAADERLRDALVSVASGERLSFGVPDIVDDASYAVECAAVGEVDLEGLERQIQELHRRLAALEHPLWPRVRRRLARLVRR
jgi:hypothetical protein